MSRRPGPVRAPAVYVHAPFCARRCSYCDFAVTVRRRGDANEWTEALRDELELVEREGLIAPAAELRTLYVGGGTPSLLGPHAMTALGDLLGRERLSRADLEWTCEANPESFSSDVARGWARAGVNRISLGAQTFHEGALRWMGRLHGPEGPGRAVRAARAAGLSNVSVDLIFGLPLRLGRVWKEDLRRAIELDAPHVSLYGLTVEPATPLGRALREGREGPVDEEQYREEFLLASEVLRDAGYEHYEVSSFSRPGARARHNAGYWEGTPYLGLGNGAHSYAPPVRRWNVRDWEDYRARLREDGSAEEGRETLDGAARRLERIWLRLRTAEGLPIAAAGPKVHAAARAWAARGLGGIAGETLRLTPEGWLLLDRISVELDAVWEEGPDAHRGGSAAGEHAG